MISASRCAGSIALSLLFGLGQAACNTRTPGTDDAAPAPVDSGIVENSPDTSTATPPIIPPSPSVRDTPPPSAKPGKPAGQAGNTGGLKVSRPEYEGWRQYSVNCARCHGQDVLPNPVAANLLVSLKPGGPFDTPEKFREVVTKGRPNRGMPAFGPLLTPEQVDAIFAYVKGRAEGRISPGRPEQPA
jgi:mono/diheme cytochrome c family protein